MPSIRGISFVLALLSILMIGMLTAGYAANVEDLVEQAQAEQDLAKKVSLFQQAAEMGSSEAQYQLWHFYRKGQGVPRNDATALQWLQKAADGGNRWALIDLARYYETATLDRRPNLAEAVKAYRKAEAAGYVYAGTWLKKILPYANRLEANPRDVDAAVELGEAYLAKSRYITSLFWFEFAARSQHPEGLLRAGSLYEEPYRSARFGEEEKPTGIPQDLEKAFRYYKRSADLGNQHAQFRMGLAYRYGKKGYVEKNLDKAIHYFNLAAKQGSANAVRQLNEIAPKKKVDGAVRDCQHCPDMMQVPAGTFTMGSPATEKGRKANEGPQHKVTFTQPFYVAAFEITNKQYDACRQDQICEPVAGLLSDRDRLPVQPPRVSWGNAQQYITWLRQKTGKSYRLLSEAEWEYAARAGTTTPFHFGQSIPPNKANCFDCQPGRWNGLKDQTFPPGLYNAPNAFGLHDMHGNANEWVADCWHEDYTGAPADGSIWSGPKDCHRVIRGGYYVENANDARSAARKAGYTGSNGGLLSGGPAGIRVMRPVEAGGAKQKQQSAPITPAPAPDENPNANGGEGYFNQGLGFYDQNRLVDAFAAWSAASQAGHAKAAFNIGVMFERRMIEAEVDGKPDYDQSSMWYERAADLGHAKAMYRLGLHYKNYWIGEFEEAFRNALRWFNKAAVKNYDPARKMAGWMMAGGNAKGPPPPIPDAEIERPGGKRANSQQQSRPSKQPPDHSLGRQYADNYSKALVGFEKGLGLYDQNKLVEAFQVWSTAAQGPSGYAKAAFNIGVMFERKMIEVEVDGKPDYDQSGMWYEKAAVKGHGKAMYRLGLHYYNGWLKSSDGIEAAVFWFNKAGVNGYKPGGEMAAYLVAGNSGGYQKPPIIYADIERSSNR